MRLLLYLFFSLFALTSIAQKISFVVYYTKGVSGKVGTNGALKKGDKLFPKDVITVNPGAQLTLICSNYETVKLTAKGRFTVSSLTRQCENNKTSFTSNYFNYIWDELTNTHGGEDPSHYMKNGGAVSRGCSTVETKLVLDTVILPIYKSSINRITFPVLFITTIEHPVLSRFISTDDGDSVWQTPLDKNSFEFGILSKEIPHPGISYWRITGEVEPTCEPNVLIVLSEKEYSVTVNKMLANLPPASAAETAYMKAFILEENHFIGEAFRYYEQAFKLAPTVEKYKLARSRFYE